jgi:Asp-tRNA(Asn)/Glu-tRNA(Gln) amidotransferase A subunit family amidase
VYGHKPTSASSRQYGYLDNPSFHPALADVNVFGALARSVDDLQLLSDLLVAPRRTTPS